MAQFTKQHPKGERGKDKRKREKAARKAKAIAKGRGWKHNQKHAFKRGPKAGKADNASAADDAYISEWQRKKAEQLPRAVFKLPHATIWGGNIEAREGHKWDAVVCLGVKPRMDYGATSNNAMFARSAAVAQARMTTPELFVDWLDYSAPPPDMQGVEFWIELMRDLKRAKGDVLVHCMGGHGRTGTALAAMAFVAPFVGFEPIVPEGQCVVEWVRANYSEWAVESDDQTDFLEAIGAYVSEASKRSVHWSGYYGGGYGHSWGYVPNEKANGKPSTNDGGVRRTVARGNTSNDAAIFCDFCGVECGVEGRMTIFAPEGRYCSDNCMEHDTEWQAEKAEHLAAAKGAAFVKGEGKQCPTCGAKGGGQIESLGTSPDKSGAPWDDYLCHSCGSHWGEKVIVSAGAA